MKPQCALGIAKPPPPISYKILLCDKILDELQWQIIHLSIEVNYRLSTILKGKLQGVGGHLALKWVGVSAAKRQTLGLKN